MSYREDLATNGGEAYDFISRFTKSDRFDVLYNEGMNLIEETTNYIDGEGRSSSSSLSTQVALAYVSESMRLTTRLMHVASWLFIHKALNEGEIDVEQCRLELSKIRPQIKLRHKPHELMSDLPLAFRALVKRSVRLNERILALETSQASGSEGLTGRSSVHASLKRLDEAFRNH